MKNPNCQTCGEALEDWQPDEEWPHCDYEGNDVCEECMRNAQDECPLCEDWFFHEEMSTEIIVVNKELAIDQGMQPGFYQVKERPYFRAAVAFGFEQFFNGAIEFVKPLPDNEEFDVSGPICKECSEKHGLECVDSLQ